MPLFAEEILGEETEEGFAGVGLGADVPLFVGPDVGRPPGSASAPGAVGFVDGVAGALEEEGGGALGLVPDVDGDGGTAAAEGDGVA